MACECCYCTKHEHETSFSRPTPFITDLNTAPSGLRRFNLDPSYTFAVEPATISQHTSSFCHPEYPFLQSAVCDRHLEESWCILFFPLPFGQLVISLVTAARSPDSYKKSTEANFSGLAPPPSFRYLYTHTHFRLITYLRECTHCSCKFLSKLLAHLQVRCKMRNHVGKGRLSSIFAFYSITSACPAAFTDQGDKHILACRESLIPTFSIAVRTPTTRHPRPSAWSSTCERLCPLKIGSSRRWENSLVDVVIAVRSFHPGTTCQRLVAFTQRQAPLDLILVCPIR